MGQNFGERLKGYRKEKNLTQQDLAVKLGVSNKTVSRWESGGGYPDMSMLIPLARALGVTADDLLDGETPVRTLTQADWQNLLSFAFALGGGVLFYLLKLFIPTLVCYLAYLGAMAYGVYLQRHYCYQSRWFRTGNAIMNFSVNVTLMGEMAGSILAFLGTGVQIETLFQIAASEIPFLLILAAAILTMAAVLTAVTLFLVESHGFDRRLHLKFTIPALRFFVPALGMALLTGFWAVFRLEKKQLLIAPYTSQRLLYYMLLGVLVLACLLLFFRRGHWMGLAPTAVMAIGGLVLPGLMNEYALLSTSKRFVEVTPTLSEMYPRIGVLTLESAVVGIILTFFCLVLVLLRLEEQALEKPE